MPCPSPPPACRAATRCDPRRVSAARRWQTAPHGAAWYFKFARKAPQPPALKPPSTARTAGRSDWAERRFRRQPIILLFVTASSIPLVSAESGENSLIPLRLLFPPNPLRWASAGALLFSDNRLICPKYAEGASHTARENPLQSGFKSHSHKRPTFAFALESGYTLAFANRIAHSGSHGEARAFQRRVQRACGTAMRSCASLSRGVAAPLGCAARCCILRRIDHLRSLSPPHRCAEKELPSASRVRLSRQPCLCPASRSGFV